MSAAALFLSYAREDTDAARRMADALRSHGIEVFFDQSELRDARGRAMPSMVPAAATTWRGFMP